MTLATWVKTNSTDDRIRVIISKAYGVSGDDSYVLWYDGSSVWFSIQNVGRISTELPTANEWHSIIGTYNGSIMRLYLDGVEKTNAAATGSLVYTDNPVLIGADINRGDGIPDEGWSGLIDDVLIYNRSLTQAEIMQIIPEFPVQSGAATFHVNNDNGRRSAYMETQKTSEFLSVLKLSERTSSTCPHFRIVDADRRWNLNL